MLKFVNSSFFLTILKRNPDRYVISPAGTELYALAPGDQVIEFSGPNFKEMNEDQCNKYIVDSIKKVRS